MENEVRVLSITIENVKGLEGPYELNLGKPIPGKGRLITLIGDNEAGKTSFCKGIWGLFSGGHNTDLIRKGAEKARISAILSDGSEIERTITAKGHYPKVKPPEGGIPPKAIETYFKSLGSGPGFDPLLFCKMKKEERLNYLLRVMPIEFTEDEIAVAMGKKAVALLQPPSGPQNITNLDKFVKDLIARRGAIGTRRDEKAETVETLRKTLLTGDQDDDPRDWKKELALLGENRDAILKQERADVALIEGQLRDARQGLDAEIRKADDDARDEFLGLLERARKGDDLRTDERLTAFLAEDLMVLAERTKVLMDAAVAAQAAIDKVRADAATAIEGMATAITAAKAGADAQIRSGSIREQMEKFRKEARALSNDWDAVAAAIKAIGELRRSKLSNLPVDGIEVREDGEILVNALPFDEINTGEQYLKSMQIGAMSLGDAGLMFIDEAEHLGPTNWDLMEQAVIASGMTVIATRVASRAEVEKYGPGLRSEPAEALVLA